MDPLILKQDMIICIMGNSNHKIQSWTLRSQKKLTIIWLFPIYLDIIFKNILLKVAVKGPKNTLASIGTRNKK